MHSIWQTKNHPATYRVHFLFDKLGGGHGVAFQVFLRPPLLDAAVCLRGSGRSLHSLSVLPACRPAGLGRPFKVPRLDFRPPHRFSLTIFRRTSGCGSEPVQTIRSHLTEVRISTRATPSRSENDPTRLHRRPAKPCGPISQSRIDLEPSPYRQFKHELNPVPPPCVNP